MTIAIAPPDPANLQGLILRGYTHPASCHLLFAFDGNQAAAKSFVRALLPRVQSAAHWGTSKPETMLNVALTFNGIRTASDLGNDARGFPWTFRTGPELGGSQDSLCDLGDSQPANWWNGAFRTSAIDCIVHAYALSPELLAAFVHEIANAASAAGVRELTRFEQQFLPDDEIHFGYRDGISNPDLAWPDPWPAAGEFSDPAALNNFVIGYGGSRFGPGPMEGNAGAFAKDGCYLAFRVIAQDVALFETFLDRHATPEMPRERLAAKLMGRWRNGSPLILSPDAPSDATRNATLYGYADDPAGAKCPFSAHGRVANPRDEAVDAADSPVPRLIRRGMPYGAPDGGNDRGLIGLFLCGALASQFEKIYFWFNANTFSPVFGPGFNTQDAVVGNRLQPGANTTFLGMTLPQFLTTRGTAYCLLPSMATLAKIAAH